MNGQQAQFHDFHHTVNIGCYGHHLLDEIFGTMRVWKEKKDVKKETNVGGGRWAHSLVYDCGGKGG